LKLGTVPLILERGTHQMPLGMEGSAAVTSSLFHHKDSTVKVQRRLEPDM